MSKDYIELEAAKERLRMWITDCILAGDNDEADCFRGCIDLDSIPAADVTPVVHGRKIEDEGIGVFYLCSLCGECLPYGANYCPNCGAYMMGENNGKCE